jgi:hypothetical protein
MDLMDILLKIPVPENSPFKGQHNNSCFVHATGILYETKMLIKYVIFAYKCLSTVRLKNGTFKSEGR